MPLPPEFGSVLLSFGARLVAAKKVDYWVMTVGDFTATMESCVTARGSVVTVGIEAAVSHYDILGGLKAMLVVGRINDPRCADALDRLESKRLATGGWPAGRKYYHVSGGTELGAEHVDWGGTSKNRLNPWVTVDALAVLRAAGRLVI